MKKTKAFILAALLCVSMTGCTSNNDNAAVETTYDTTASETVSATETTTVSTTAEPETTTESETTTAEETTTVTETTVETAETTEDGKLISPSGWILDKNVLASDLGDRPEPEPDKAYFICELPNGDNIYGVGTQEKRNGNNVFVEYTIIEHDGIIDELKRSCFGIYDPLECELFDMNSDGEQEIFSSLQYGSGMMTSMSDMVIFIKNENGHYEMIDIEGLTDDSLHENDTKENALSEEMLSRIKVEWTEDKDKVKFSTGTSECTVDLEKMGIGKDTFGEYTNEDLQKNLTYMSPLKGYYVLDNTLYFATSITILTPNQSILDCFCNVGGELIYSDGEFTLGNNMDIAPTWQ